MISTRKIQYICKEFFEKQFLNIIFLTASVPLFSKVPNNQDCLGAKPICQNSYANQNAYTGTGNYANEITIANSCLAYGERNDVWYTFTVTQSGSLTFLITPDVLTDDYDPSGVSGNFLL